MSERDVFRAQAAVVREQMERMQRSVRASIARSYRLDQSAEYVSPSDFIESHETKIQYFGLALGEAALKVRKAEAEIIARGIGPTIRHFRALLLVLWHINESTSSKWREDRRAGNVLDVLLEVHAQSIVVAEEAFMLLEVGHPIAAQVRWRTLYELEAVIRVLAVSGDRAARVYKASSIAEEHRSQAKFDEIVEENSRIARHRDRIEREFRRISSVYTPRELSPYGWISSLFPETKKRFSVNDLISSARQTVPKDHFFHSDYLRYVRASQHGHGVRASSTTMLRKRMLPQGPVFLPAGGDLVRTAMSINVGIMRITDVLQDFTWSLFGNEESAYWSSIASMVSLDVSTEAMWSDMTIEPGLFGSLGSVVPGGRSTWLRSSEE